MFSFSSLSAAARPENNSTHFFLWLYLTAFLFIKFCFLKPEHNPQNFLSRHNCTKIGQRKFSFQTVLNEYQICQASFSRSCMQRSGFYFFMFSSSYFQQFKLSPFLVLHLTKPNNLFIVFQQIKFTFFFPFLHKIQL